MDITVCEKWGKQMDYRTYDNELDSLLEQVFLCAVTEKKLVAQD